MKSIADINSYSMDVIDKNYQKKNEKINGIPFVRRTFSRL